MSFGLRSGRHGGSKRSSSSSSSNSSSSGKLERDPLLGGSAGKQVKVRGIPKSGREFPPLLPEDYDDYQFSVAEDKMRGGAGSGNGMSESKRKMRYLFHEVLGDFSLWKAHTSEFWVSVTTLAIAVWLRVYTHF